MRFPVAYIARNIEGLGRRPSPDPVFPIKSLPLRLYTTLMVFIGRYDAIDWEDSP